MSNLCRKPECSFFPNILMYHCQLRLAAQEKALINNIKLDASNVRKEMDQTGCCNQHMAGFLPCIFIYTYLLLRVLKTASEIQVIPLVCIYVLTWRGVGIH